MSTIDSPSSISTILANSGAYPGDPPCYSVLSYTNNWGNKTWAVTYSQADEQRYFDSPSIHAITYLFMNGELTQDGLAHLEQYPSTQENFQ